MARRVRMGSTTFDAALDRLIEVYEEGHRVVISFSGGKDSGVVLELAIMAARLTGRLPVEVVMRDEEIMYPGTFEYAERVANRPEVDFHWLVANQPIVNVFNVRSPYFWTFDPLLPPEKWVRKPPPFAEYIPEKNIQAMTTPQRFPPPEGKHLYAVIGIRTSESRGRMYGLFSAKGHRMKPNDLGVRSFWPIYDWSDGDVWRAIRENGWDYNRAYDALFKLGIKPASLRIAPPTLNLASLPGLQAAARAWPRWFDRVCDRLEGVRQVVLFGKQALVPKRRLGETWQQCFQRVCIDEAPADWIRERAIIARDRYLSTHARHSTAPLPEVTPCYACQGNIGSWKALTMALWNGDPFSMKAPVLPYVEPEFFREGAGTWGGTPSW